ncbi:Stigma-specific Stig1 family protein [Euphorbia peplus]|nr:Stigma-specific Stig1 family protein [Euphorbia peplus]
MELIKVVLIIAITLGLSITLTMRGIANLEDQNPGFNTNDSKPPKEEHQVLEMPSKRLSRFLADVPNPRAADHCNKDSVLCYVLLGKNYTCCNNKCIDLQTDNKNCGACKNKCKFTQACCSGKCVYLNHDKRHCKTCGNRCKDGEFCIYGMCNYSY